MAITSYSTNPNLNTAISGIDIAEGCLPGTVNDAIRQMMADIREFYNTAGGGVLPVATASVKGIVELATNAETQAGTDAARAVTPAGLSARTATTARTGLIKTDGVTLVAASDGLANVRDVTLANTLTSLGLAGTALGMGQLGRGVSMGAGKNLDDFVESGCFYFSSGATPTNWPMGVNGLLWVVRGGGVAKQFVFRHGTLDSNDHQIAYRTMLMDAANKATPGPWYRLDLFGNLATPAETVAGTVTTKAVTPAGVKAAIAAGDSASAARLTTARTIAIKGGAAGTATAFDGTKNISIPITGLNMDYVTHGTLPVERGGTGVTSIQELVQALYTPGGSKATFGYILTFDTSGAASGYTKPLQARNALGLGNTLGALPVANGGTNATTAAAALTSLGAAPVPKAASGVGQWVRFTAGTIPKLPSGGTWAYFMYGENTGSGGGCIAGVAAGGSTLSGPTNSNYGFCWRVA